MILELEYLSICYICMKNNLLVAVLVTAVVVGGGSFFAGMKYGQSSKVAVSGATGAERFAQGGTGGGNRNRFQGGGVVSGKILTIDASGITVETRGGAQGETTGSKIVLLSGSTQIMKAVSGSTADLSVGQQVTAMGTANSDGSVTAQSVQIRPNMPTHDGTSTPPTTK